MMAVLCSRHNAHAITPGTYHEIGDWQHFRILHYQKLWFSVDY